MRCEHFWRDGILRVERGEQDPHLETCEECRRARKDRDRLVQALPRVGLGATGDPGWQARVWRRIAHEETARARRSYWLGAGLIVACAIAVLYYAKTAHREEQIATVVPQSTGAAGTAPEATHDRPRIEIVTGQLAMRSTSARVGDRVRISVARGQEARIYRADLRNNAW